MHLLRRLLFVLQNNSNWISWKNLKAEACENFTFAFSTKFLSHARAKTHEWLNTTRNGGRPWRRTLFPSLMLVDMLLIFGTDVVTHCCNANLPVLVSLSQQEFTLPHEGSIISSIQCQRMCKTCFFFNIQAKKLTSRFVSLQYLTK